MMPQFTLGPIYCETLSATSTAFPVEPMNTVSNGVIVLFGLLSLYVVVKRAPRMVDLYLLATLLILTGIGSGVWHGFRDGDALFWEVQSGLFFLFALVFCWARRLWSYLGASVALLAFYLGFDYSRELFPFGVFGVPGRWVAITPLVIGFGAVMIAQTAFRSRPAALTGALSLALAVVAVTFRSIDSFASVCAAMPIGTHFLWHSCLSAAAFVGVLTLIRLSSTTASASAANPATEAAE